MKKLIDTKYGEVIVKDVMIKIDKKTLEEGVEVNCKDLNFRILISGVEAEDFDQDQIEDIIKENS